METKFNYAGLVIKERSNSEFSDCDACCLRSSCNHCSHCPLQVGFHFEESSESPQVSSFKNRSDSSHKVVEVRDFTSYSVSDLKDAIKWHKVQLKFWTDCLGSAIFLGRDAANSFERVAYHSACICKAQSCIKMLKRCGLSCVK